MKKKSIFVELYNEDRQKDDKGHYGVKILSFKKVDSFPEGAKIFESAKNERTATVANYDFGDLSLKRDYGKMTDEDFKKEEKFIVSALRFSVISNSKCVLEFDEDLYGKFVFITKMEKGSYISVE